MYLRLLLLFNENNEKKFINNYLKNYENMGKLLSKLFSNKQMRILMLGLDAAGTCNDLNKDAKSILKYLF